MSGVSIHALFIFILINYLSATLDDSVPSWFVSQNSTWNDARQHCESVNGSLVQITEDNYIKIRQCAGKDDVWIGAYAKNHPNITPTWIEHIGCFNSVMTDDSPNGKIPLNSPQQCSDFCQDDKFFAAQGEKCFCLNGTTNTWNSLRQRAGNCTDICNGNSKYFCGGINSVNVYGQVSGVKTSSQRYDCVLSSCVEVNGVFGWNRSEHQCTKLIRNNVCDDGSYITEYKGYIDSRTNCRVKNAYLWSPGTGLLECNNSTINETANPIWTNTFMNLPVRWNLSEATTSQSQPIKCFILSPNYKNGILKEDCFEKFYFVCKAASDPAPGISKQCVPKSTDQSYTAPNSTDQSYTVPNSTEQSYTVPNSTDQSYSVTDSTDQSYSVTDSTDQSYIVPNSTDQRYSVPNSTDQSYSVTDSTDQSYIVPNSTDQSYSVTDSTDQSYTVTNRTDPSYSVPNSTDQSYSVADSTDQSYTVTNSTDQSYSVTNSTEQSYRVTDSTDQSYTVTNSTDQSYTVLNSTDQSYTVPNSTDQSYSVTDRDSTDQSYTVTNSTDQSYSVTDSTDQSYTVSNSTEQSYNAFNNTVQNKAPNSTEQNHALNYSTEKSTQPSYYETYSANGYDTTVQSTSPPILAMSEPSFLTDVVGMIIGACAAIIAVLAVIFIIVCLLKRRKSVRKYQAREETFQCFPDWNVAQMDNYEQNGQGDRNEPVYPESDENTTPSMFASILNQQFGSELSTIPETDEEDTYTLAFPGEYDELGNIGIRRMDRNRDSYTIYSHTMFTSDPNDIYDRARYDSFVTYDADVYSHVSAGRAFSHIESAYDTAVFQKNFPDVMSDNSYSHIHIAPQADA